MGDKNKTKSKSTLRRVEGKISSVAGLIGKEPALVIFIRPWREDDGPLQRKEMRVEVPLKSASSVSSSMAKWNGETVSLSVQRVSKASGNRLELNVARSRLRRVKPSVEQNALEAQQSKPVVAKSRLLGTLVLQRDFNWYEGKRATSKHTYEVLVTTSDPDDPVAVNKALGRAESAARAVEKALPRIRETIARELVDTYNNSWREHDEPTLTTSVFKRCHQLTTLVVEDGRITLRFKNGGLFADHLTEVRLTPRLKVREVCLA